MTGTLRIDCRCSASAWLASNNTATAPLTTASAANSAPVVLRPRRAINRSPGLVERLSCDKPVTSVLCKHPSSGSSSESVQVSDKLFISLPPVLPARASYQAAHSLAAARRSSPGRRPGQQPHPRSTLALWGYQPSPPL